MTAVEVRIRPADIGGRMDELRRWLAARGCAHKITSTGSSAEAVVFVEFASQSDASDFAMEFGGSVVLT